MIYDVYNPTQQTRWLKDADGKLIRLLPGARRSGITVDPLIVHQLMNSENDLAIYEVEDRPAEPNGALPAEKLPIDVLGMYGIGDNLHQRAVIRELMTRYDVWLHTCHVWLYHDLIQQGLKLKLRPTKLWMHAKNVMRERAQYRSDNPPADAHKFRIWYLKREIDLTGSMLGAMYLSCGLEMKAPDFSLPIPESWRQKADALRATWGTSKPLLIYRPIVLRKEWDSEARNPDPDAYRALFAEIRDRYFVVSVAALKPGTEWIVGPEQDADIKLHNGELDYETMAALFRQADLVFCNAGFAPVMAQAVGTASIVIYGGRESFKTSQSVGAHLAPTLGIDPDRPCDCHSHNHACDKRITLEPARINVREFVEMYGRKICAA